MSDHDEFTFPTTASTRHRQRSRGANPILILFFLLVGVAALGALGWVLTKAVKRNTAEPEPAKTESPQSPRQKPPSAASSVPSPPIVKVVGKQTDTTPKPPPSPPTFDEATNEAARIAEALDKEEPPKTRQAMALLTGIEQLEITGLADRPALEVPHEFQRRLVQLGLTDRVAALSRHAARESKDFPAVARKLWEPTTGAEGIVAMMNRWGTVDDFTRHDVVYATNNNTPTAQLFPETRNAILLLGGKTWLQR